MSDVGKMTRMAAIVKPGSALQRVLHEVVGVVPKVASWTIVPTSGSAACHYDTATGNALNYDVRYQQGNIGNLVHELIHVCVNESYKQDFINYPNPDADVPARTYDDTGRCTNEELRQMKFMNDASNATVSGKLAALTGWANASKELTPQQRLEITSKFGYGMQWPHKEYDTVITQVLVWLHEWGFPTLVAPGSQKPVVNALYEELEKFVMAAYLQRQAAL